MFGPPSSPAIAAINALAIAAAVMGFGYLLVGSLPLRPKPSSWLRWGLAFPAVIAYALVLMLLHIATGGWVFSHPGFVRGFTLVVAVGSFAWSRARAESSPQSARLGLVVAAALVIIATLVWGSPLARMLALDYVFDTNLHMGWTSQLLYGDPLPTATITGEVPNYYPWLFHALVAFLTALTPGGRPWHALAPLHLMQVWAIVLALFGIGMVVGRTLWSGASVALLGALTGGFGFLIARAPAVVLNPRGNDGQAALRFMGDMIATRPYNVTFQNLPPPFPRDVAYALLAAAILLGVVAFRERSLSAAAGSGAVVGMIGLTGGETFLVGLATVALLGLTAGFASRPKALLAFLGPALALWSLWLVPLVLAYVRYGGFVETAAAPVILTPLAVVVAFGITGPLAVVGAGVALKEARERPGVRVLLVYALVCVLYLAATALIGDVSGFSTLGRTHRYWPLMYLALAMFGGLGAERVAGLLAGRGRAVLAAAATLAVACALASPVLAAVAIPPARGEPKVLRDSLAGERTFLNLVAPEPGMRCVAAAPPDISQRVFSYTGYKLVIFRWTKTVWRNAAHIRWKDIYEHIPPVQDRMPKLRALLNGYDAAAWRRFAGDFELNYVITEEHNLDGPAFDGYPAATADGFAVVEVEPCD